MTAELFLSQASDLRPHFTIPAIARGVGHPDEIARGLAAAAATALEERATRDGVREGAFALGTSILVPGIALPRFGGGRTGAPMRIVLAGMGPKVPGSPLGELEEVAHAACARWIRTNLRFVDPERHVAFELTLREPPAARSDAIGIARAPLSASQYLATEVVSLTQADDFRLRFPEVGEDVEASALAIEGSLRVHVAMAFVDRLVHAERSYFVRKVEIGEYLQEKLRALPTDFDRIDVTVNPDDRRGEGEVGLFLTVLGTSADGRRPGHADPAPDGERTSPHAESFVKAILARVRGVRAAVVRLQENERAEIDRAFVRVELHPGTSFDAVRSAIQELVPLQDRKSRSIDPHAI